MLHRIALAFLSLCLVACGGGGSVGSSRSYRIMPLGDSITVGVPIDGGYRRPLESRLRTRFEFDFVGSQGVNSSSVERPQHEGHSGWTIADYIGESDLFRGAEAPIKTFVRSAAPDVVLLLLGTNDLYVGEEEFARRYRILLEDIYDTAPNAKVVFMELLPRRDHDALVEQGHVAAEAVVEEFRGRGKMIVLVNPKGEFDPSTMSEDGLHPNDEGYEVVARLFEEGIAKLQL